MAIEHLHAVPHLTTALTGPLQEIERHLLGNQAEIERWFRSQWLITPAPFYTSVDLRNAGFKLAPVDTNLFPAGFNNLNPVFLPLCIQAIQVAAERICPTAAKVVLIPEKHTRNQFYLENLSSLMNIMVMAGFEVKLGTLSKEINQPTDFNLASGKQITMEPVQRKGNRLYVGDFEPCFILLNNDLSGGIPEILKDLDQPVVPPVALGWTDRRKSDHFAHYRRVADELAKLTKLDPWLIDPLFRKCGRINFQKREGEDCLVRNVSELLEQIQDQYDKYDIGREPFVVVKADAGTYGMGIMTVRSSDDVRELNRKQRNKMAKVKEGQQVTEVLVQEGVYSFETWDEAVAEPVVYMIDHSVVGGFYRVHTGRGPNENLNAPGMHFEPLAFDNSCTTPDAKKAPNASTQSARGAGSPNRFYAYGVIARLAALAAAREIAASR